MNIDIATSIQLLAGLARRAFPGPAAEPVYDGGGMAVCSLTEPNRDTIGLFATIDDTGEFTLASQNLLIEQQLKATEPADVAGEAFGIIEPYGRFGIAYVRAVHWLGPVSPSAVGPIGSTYIERWKRYPFSRTIWETPGWATRNSDT